jgi:hypothetical protein
MPMTTPPTTSYSRLAARWRQEANDLRDRYDDARSARLCEVHALELETAEQVGATETLTMTEAVRLSGYTDRHLRALVADGTLTNAGRKGAPRLLRSELPRKRIRQVCSGPEAADAPTGLPARRKGPRPGAPRRR